MARHNIGWARFLELFLAGLSCQNNYADDCDNPAIVDLYSSPLEYRFQKYPSSMLYRDGEDEDGIPFPPIQYGRKAPTLASVLIGSGTTAEHRLTLRVRCRKCDTCLEHRRKMWIARIIDEWGRATRTVFTTYTVRPAVRLDYAERAAAKGISIPALMGEEFTKYNKRIRKTRAVRFFQVYEYHADGFPHIHCLYHQYYGQEFPIREFRTSWRDGFTDARLGNPDTDPQYLAKYLVKGNNCGMRLRASQKYGRLE